MNKLKGKKTYITAAVTTILLVIGHFLDWDQATIEKIIYAGVMGIGIFIRSGIASTLGISAEANKVAEILKEADAKALIKTDAIQTAQDVFNAAPSLQDIEKVMELASDLDINPKEFEFIKDNAASWLMKIAADPEVKG